MSSSESVKERAEKPTIDEFALGRQIGEGNFSRIMLATHKATGEVFALKVIEKQRVKRLKIRHPNIFNEINMEKEVLNKLRHPNVIRLYQTFQDHENLYFLLEYIEGGELLNHLVHEGTQVGIHEDLARFYLADIVNAIEYLHANQIIHRDLKPENMVVSAGDGHLRLVDFGTAKDLGNTALNGPNFVGTPEYMSPETVDNKEVDASSDLWALGCIAFQMLAGESPFSGGSAYLTFLRVQHGAYHLPGFLSDDARALIEGLLQKEPSKRLSIEQIKDHPFFKTVDFATHMETPRPVVHFHDSSYLDLARELEHAEQERVRQQSLDFSSCPIQSKIVTLSTRQRELLMHILRRKNLLHLPGIFPRFFAQPAIGRCLHAQDGGYLGFSHHLQNQWNDVFNFIAIAGPCLGRDAAEQEQDGGGGSTWSKEEQDFRRAIVLINDQHPAFVAIVGDFVHARSGQTYHGAQVDAFRNLLNEIHPEIKLVFVPGTKSVSTMVDYQTHFGDDHYSFWYGGVKFIVVNSSILASSGDHSEAAAIQEEWLARELDYGKLCARDTIVFSAHAFHQLRQGPELPPHLMPTNNQGIADDTPEGWLPAAVRKRYVELVAKHTPRLIVTAQGQQPDRVVTVHTSRHGHGDDDDAEMKKTELAVCQSPYSSAAAMHIVQVMQSGITIKQIRASSAVERKHSTTPEDVDSALTAEAVALEIS